MIMGTTGQSITLANSIIGVGILAMPFCFQQCGVLLATLILLFMGLVSRLCCYFLLKSAFLARRRNFEFLAFHVFGSAGKFAVEVGIIGFLMGTCIAYFVVVGDLGPQIVSKMFNINQSDMLRTSIMVIVSLVCVLPLGLLRNVDSLSNVSAATIGFYFCLVIKVIVEAASQLPSGEWQHRMEIWKPSGVLQCVPIFSMALFCQTQLFEIFESLPSLSLEKMNVVTKNAINICTGVYFTLGVFGYIAFSSQVISGNILMSLSETMASDVIKLGFVMSLAFSFPLIIFPCRASLYSFLYKKVHSSHHDHIINHSIPETTFRCMTVGIILAALCISLLIPNIELVLGLVGSTIGVLICIVFPAACFVHLTFKNTNERLLAKGVLILGLVIMVLGTYANLQAAETQIDRYDDRYITQEKIDKIVEDFFEKRENGKERIPVPKKELVKLDASKISNNIKKDSEVQPPNPVPPESNSNELRMPDPLPKIDVNKITNDKLANDILLPEKLKEAEAADTVSDSHPKNLKNKLAEAKLTNGNAVNDKTVEKPKPLANEENKVEKIKLIKQQQLIETMKQHGKEQKELMQEQKEILDEIIKNKKDINVEKSRETKPSEEPKVEEDNKQQKLIETIKQHGEEQKELMKEQKEILDEIKELQQNKETGSNEAKKIAVESIKQIADMAIKSIGGVTEKPEAKKADRLEKLTNEAVQEIAKKAVETIEAIQEIKEKPEAKSAVEDPKPIHDKPALPINANNVEANVKEAPIVNQILQQYNHNVEPNPINVKRELQSDMDPKAVINQVKEQLETMKTAANVKEPAPIAKNLVDSQNIEGEVEDIISNIETKAETNNVAANLKDSVAENVAQVNIENQIPKENALKHSHSPDEPQSYKEGEDLQIKHVDTLNQNVPLAVAMSDKAKLDGNKENHDHQAIKKILKQKTIALDNIVRQKRNAIDCAHTKKLSAADKKSCEVLLQGQPDEVLQSIDLNDDLSRFPMNPNIHFGRSLKNYKNDNKR